MHFHSTLQVQVLPVHSNREVIYLAHTPTTAADHCCCSIGNRIGLRHVSFWLRTWETDVLDWPKGGLLSYKWGLCHLTKGIFHHVKGVCVIRWRVSMSPCDNVPSHSRACECILPRQEWNGVYAIMEGFDVLSWWHLQPLYHMDGVCHHMKGVYIYHHMKGVYVIMEGDYVLSWWHLRPVRRPAETYSSPCQLCCTTAMRSLLSSEMNQQLC